MRRKSIEFCVEDFFIRLLRADSRLTGKEICHFEDERRAKTAAITVLAVKGERNQAAFGGFNLEVTVEMRAPAATRNTVNSLISAGITESIDSPSVSQEVLQTMRSRSGLSHINIADETTGDRQNTSDLRKRSFTFPVQARMT